ncbi:hypothetical protein CTI12_AA545260 [Artemisia annua]|uniref:DUF7866 domain-containing protein n=1 Tax=Artemisia annua TaxID=35608 RepID=A0A2U1L0A7_ARTAN|nr:hypothetical protein CTI12_AA545260 [Artemisia annua]
MRVKKTLEHHHRLIPSGTISTNTNTHTNSYLIHKEDAGKIKARKSTYKTALSLNPPRSESIVTEVNPEWILEIAPHFMSRKTSKTLIVEIRYASGQCTYYTVIVYAMVSFEWTVTKFFWLFHILSYLLALPSVSLREGINLPMISYLTHLPGPIHAKFRSSGCDQKYNRYNLLHFDGIVPEEKRPDDSPATCYRRGLIAHRDGSDTINSRTQNKRSRSQIVATLKVWCAGIYYNDIFAPKASAGPHKARDCLSLVLILRSRLKYVLSVDVLLVNVEDNTIEHEVVMPVPVGRREYRVLDVFGWRMYSPFKLCSTCKCCVTVSDPTTCMNMQCCYGIHCNLPHKPFGICAFMPNKCNCSNCAST